jgi:hypothetical protein
LSGFQVTPSTFQVNEGDSLTTSLSGFTPGSTLYFKVSGRGINKKDFASGGVKGRVQVDANGVATISHALRADKTTEGDESFAIQVFSDKKMRNLLGQSDAVTVIDTSAKAVKTPKGGGNNQAGTPKSNSLSFKDPLTGQLLQSDQVYNGFFNTRSYAAWESGRYEIEMNKDSIIYTQQLDGWKGDSSQRPGRTDVSRLVLRGDFKVDKNGNLTGTAKSFTTFGVQSDPDSGYFKESGESYSLRSGSKITSSLFSNSPPNFEAALYYFEDTVGSTNFNRFPGTTIYSERKQLSGLQDASFYPEGWWQNPFSPNLI